MDKQTFEEWFAYEEATGTLYRRKSPIKGPGIAGDAVGHKNVHGYIVTSFLGQPVPVHRIIACMRLGLICNDRSKVVDHINGDKSDNRIQNLRVTDVRGNARNQVIHRQGHPAGITFSSRYNYWRVQITVQGSHIALGTYSSLEEARDISAFASLAATEGVFVELLEWLELPRSRKRGTAFHKANNKWAAYIISARKKKHLGYYNTEQEAHEAYLLAKT